MIYIAKNESGLVIDRNFHCKIERIGRERTVIASGMLLSSSISECSQQNGEISILPVEDGHFSTFNVGEEDPAQPYQGEPISDEEWVSQYIERRNTEKLRLQILRSRSNGSETVGNW